MLSKQRIFSKSLRFFSIAVHEPYENIPGPPGQGWPFVGHTLMFMKNPHGFEKSWLNLKEVQQKYLKKNDKLIKFHSPIFNPDTGKVIFLLDPNDIEQVYRHEGKYPNRGPGFEPFIRMRQARTDIYHETNGVLMEDGERWLDFRSKVQQDLMRPKSALFYLDEIQVVGDEFIQFLKHCRSKDDNVIKNCLPEIYKYMFESICLIALNTRLGCLKTPMDEDIKNTFQTLEAFLGSVEGLLTNPSWKFLPPRWIKTFRDAQDNLDILLDFGKKHVEEAKERMKSQDQTHSDDMSVLEKMIKRCGPDSSYPLVMAIDMIFVGIDTTGNTLAFLLYHLATNPDKQEILRKECQNLGSHLSVKDLNQLKYLRACIQETNRLTPTFPLFPRKIPVDMVLQGYHIPKDTMVMWSPVLMGQQFPDHEKFIPERWLDRKRDICPFTVRQFSHGPRMCIGKRFAELELLTITHKLMNNFQIKCTNQEPVAMKQVSVNYPDKPLDFQFIDI